jgi:hypothetical protein
MKKYMSSAGISAKSAGLDGAQEFYKNFNLYNKNSKHYITLFSCLNGIPVQDL